MSINTIAKPQNAKIKVENEPRKVTPINPQKNEESVEIELNVPVIILFALVAIGLIWGIATLVRNGGNIAGTKFQLPDTLIETTADVTVTLDDAVIEGSDSAEYVFIEFSDFECPFCRIFSTGIDPRYTTRQVSTLSQIEKDYVDTGKMKYAFFPYALVPSHQPAANNEAVGYFCAKDMGKGLEFAQQIYEKTQMNGLGIDGKGAEKAAIVSVATSLGLNEAEFTSCFDKKDIKRIDTIKERINAEIRKPWTALFREENFGTPAFAVCKISAENPKQCVGKAFVGAWPYADMKEVIESVLGEKLSGTPSPTTTK